MEDSFSDFQAKKKINTGPKKLVKARVNKKLKKVRGQKDIRKVLKEKENELVSYSKNFDQVCKTSGLDVDSEQLQLAIALSKSLQDPPSSICNSSQESVPVSSQERTAKIRSTLQQYGFKTSNAVTDNKPKKRIKSNKQYKLLVISDVAKKQIISDKYSEVLVNNIHKTFNSKDIQCTNKSELYFKASDICYELMKDNDIFYVKELCFEVLHDIDMLRDWSEIPGRPLSPVLKVNNCKFNSKYYSQDQLDFILSGSIHAAQDIIKNNIKANETATKMETKIEEIFIKEEVNTNNKDNPNIQKIYMESEQILITNVRRYSPDIFDDDISILEDTNQIQIPAKTKKSTVSSQDMHITKRKSNDYMEERKVTNPVGVPEKTKHHANNQTIFMDLTGCVNIADDKSILVSQSTDITKRRSNEYLHIIEDINSIQVPHKTKNKTCNETIFMDLTGRVNIAPNKSTGLPHDIDITKRKSNDCMETTDCVSAMQCCTIDLTQAPNIQNYDKKQTNNIEVNLEPMDLTQSSNSDEESIKKNYVDNNSLDERIIVHDQLGEPDTSEKNHSLSSQKYDEQNHQDYENCSPCYSFTDHVFEHSYIYDYNNEENLDSDSGEKNPNIDTDRQSSCKNDEENNVQKKTMNENSCSNEVIPCSSDSESFHKIALSNCDVDNLQNNSGNHMQNENVIEGTNEDMNPNVTNNDLNLNNNTEEKESEDIDEQDALNVDKNLSPVYDYNDFVFEHEHVFTSEDQNSRDCDVNLRSEDLKLVDNNEDDEDLILIEKNVPNIDLTQSDSSSTEMENDIATPFTDLGKKNDVSIDYDDIIEVENAVDTKANNVSLESNSEVFNISDNEFNYSMYQSRFDDFDRHYNTDKKIETVDNISNSKFNRSLSDGNLNVESCRERKTQGLSTSSCVTTPTKVLSQDITKIINETPKNTDYIIKTNDVTPMADYASMTSPERNKELDKYGLKPFKRKRAIQLLTYIYNQTHPVVESCDVEPSPSKKPKYDKTPTKTKSPRKHSRSPQLEVKDKLYVETKEVPDIKEVVCDPEDWVFQTREKAKIHSCRVPLHIAFHNYVSCRRYLRESILRYEPINIDVIHKELVSTGHRYNPKDLLKFMDKKCITVKTADNARNKR